MTITNRLGRPMLATMFVTGGAEQLVRPEDKVGAAEAVLGEVDEHVEDGAVPAVDPQTMVRVNGAVQVAAGLLLALDKVPRLAAATLAGSLVPTTLGAHRFWELQGEARREQRVHFLKNLAMLGGLLVTVSDTGGRPSTSWRVRNAVRSRSDSAAENLTESVLDLRDATAAAAADVADSATRGVRRTADAAAPAIHDASEWVTDSASTAAERAAEVAEHAQPRLRSAADRVRDTAEGLWNVAVPAGRAAREQAGELIDRGRQLRPRKRRLSLPGVARFS